MTILLFFLFWIPAHAAELRGDWESAGAPVEPDESSYEIEFEYDCQLEMKMAEFPEIAITNFKLDPKNTFWTADKNTKWNFLELRQYEFSRILSKQDGVSKNSLLPLQGVKVYLGFTKAEKVDLVVLSLLTEWKVHEVTFSAQPVKAEFERERASLHLRTYAQAKSKGKSFNLSQQLICYKKK